MSRIGKRPIAIPKGTSLAIEGRTVKVKGAKGELTFNLPEKVEIEVQENQAQLKADYRNDQQAKMLMGTSQSLITNMVKGVSAGFTKQLNLVGVGYRAVVKGEVLELSLGYSHPVLFQLPKGVSAKMQGNASIILESCDKQLLGQTATKIREWRPPEPYKGKGILFDGERVRRKVGKSGKK